MQATNGNRDRNIKAVIFDMDNTLFDFVEAKLRAIKAVVECVGFNDEDELLQYFIKDPIDIENLDCIARYLKDRNIFDEDKYVECVENYEDIKLGNLKTYEGTRETLEKLKNTELINKVGGRFKLTALIQRRLSELMQGGRPLIENAEGMTQLEIVVQEIVQDKIEIDTEPADSDELTVTLLGQLCQAVN